MRRNRCRVLVIGVPGALRAMYFRMQNSEIGNFLAKTLSYKRHRSISQDSIDYCHRGLEAHAFNRVTPHDNQHTSILPVSKDVRPVLLPSVAKLGRGVNRHE